jgi:hypothetical protein
MKKLSYISILVVNEKREPVEDAQVTIWWEYGGFSEKKTGQSGQVIFDNLGMVGRITIWDKLARSGPVNYPSDVSLTLPLP